MNFLRANLLACDYNTACRHLEGSKYGGSEMLCLEIQAKSSLLQTQLASDKGQREADCSGVSGLVSHL